MADVRSEALPEAIGKTYSTQQLRQSLRLVGAKQVALYHCGELIDGRRRLKLAKSLRIEVPTIEIRSRIQAARELWRLHPRRAYELFAPQRARIIELATLFDCDPDEIPTSEQAWFKTRRRPRKIAGTDRGATPVVLVDRAQLKAAQAVCKQRGISMSAAIRGLVEYLAEADE